MPAGKDAGKDELNPGAWWLQTPLRSASSSLPFAKKPDSPQAGSWDALRTAQCGGSIPEGSPFGSFEVPGQAAPTAGSEDTGLAGLGMSLGFAVATPANPGGEGLWERCCPPRSPAAEGCVPS